MGIFRNVSLGLGIVLASSLVHRSAWGAATATFQTTSGNTAPTTPSVATDLFQTSLASVSPPAAGGDTLLTSTFKYNGTTGTAHESSGANPANIVTAGTYDFNLNVAVNTLGYSISEIDVYSGWIDNRAGQNYSVFYSVIGNPAFNPVALINVNQGHIDGTLRTRIFDNTLPVLATNVDALRFVENSAAPGQPGIYVYREIDVIGFATLAVESVPEPSALLLCGMMAATFAGVSRRRRLQLGN